ncbi:MAG: pseudouridine synthase [Candidatus Margulisiibacteriota bacterium]|jgi:pseudouridine synthase
MINKKLRLEQFIASQTIYSRRDLFDLYQEQKILVNGVPAFKLNQIIDPIKDKIKVDGKIIKIKFDFLYFKFNKPKNVISTLDDPQNRITLKNYLHDMPESLFPVGRLDRNTTGLLLFTNDGDLAHFLMHPKFKIKKVYQVSLDQKITSKNQERLITGLFLEDGPVVFDKIELIDEKNIIVTISEGRKHIVRRSFKALGYEVKSLKRLMFGPISLDNLKQTQFKKLTFKEINSLKILITKDKLNF